MPTLPIKADQFVRPGDLLTLSDSGVLVCSARAAIVHGSLIQYEPDTDQIGYWANQEDWVSWRVDIPEQGFFHVDAVLSCPRETANTSISLSVIGQAGQRESMKRELLATDVTDTFGIRTYETQRLGTVELAAGRQVLALSALERPRYSVMSLRKLKLTRTSTPNLLSNDHESAGTMEPYQQLFAKAN